MKEKLYTIYKGVAIVTRNNGIKEKESFLFLIECKCDVFTQIKKEFEKQIAIYNEFCPNDYFITKYENFEYKCKGELWL